MKLIFRLIASLILISFTSLLFAQQAEIKEPQMVLRPIVYNLTGLEDLIYDNIEGQVNEIINEKVNISEFATFPHVLIAHCSIVNNLTDMEKEIVGVELNFKFVLYDLLSKQQYGQKEFILKGEAKTKNEAILKALNKLVAQHKKDVNSFLIAAYDKMLVKYEISCEDILQKVREPGEMPMPEDFIINLMSIPEAARACKKRANEELSQAYMEYCIEKCDEYNRILKGLIEAENKDKERASECFRKMTCLSYCDEQVELQIPALLKLQVEVEKIIHETSKIKFDPEAVKPGSLNEKIKIVLNNVMDAELNSDPAREHMSMDKLRPVFESELLFDVK